MTPHAPEKSGRSAKVAVVKRAVAAVKPRVAAPVAPVPAKPDPADAEPQWRGVARDWAKEYTRTSGREVQILGYDEERIRVFTTREVAYSVGEMRVMTLVLRRRPAAGVLVQV